MAAGDAKWPPVKNSAWRVTFPILDNDGDLVTAAAALDSERSIDGGTFADCSNEAAEIATSSGMYTLDLNASEMNGDTIAIIVKTTTTDAKTSPVVVYPVSGSFNEIYSDTTIIHSDTIVISSDTLKIESDTTAIESELIVVHSDTTAIESELIVVHSDTTAIESELILVHSETTQLQSDTAAIESELILVHSETTVIQSDTLVIESDTTVIESDSTALETAVILASGTSDSGSTTTMVDAARTEADDDYWNGARILFTSGNIAGQVREITDFVAATDTITFSPATTQAVATQNYNIIQGVAASGLTGAQASDLVAIESELILVHSETTVIQSDTLVIESDTTKIESDTAAIESELILVHSETTVIQSDTLVIESDTTVIESDTTVLETAVVMATGTSDSGSTTTMVDAARTEADTDYWAGNRILFTSGNIAGQVREITAFTPGTDTITFSPATTQAVATQNYTILQGVTASGLSAAQASDLVAIESELILVHSETTVIQSDTLVIESDTTAIESELIQVHSETTQMQSDTAAIESELILVHSETTVVQSDTLVIESDTTVIESDTTVLEGAVVLASGTSDSGTTTTMVDAARTEADTDYWRGDRILFTSGNISGQVREITAFTPASDTITFTPATTQAVATQNYAILQGVTQASDLAAIESELILVHSETTVIQSDTLVIESDTTKIESDATAIESELILVHSETTQMQSDTAAIESELILVHSETTVIQSDTLVIESDTTVIESDTIVISSDTLAIEADLPARATKNVALSNFMFPLIDSTDDVSPITGRTVTGEISKDGGAFAGLSNAVAEVSDGWYKVNITQAEMNADSVALRFTATGANDQMIVIYTQPT